MGERRIKTLNWETLRHITDARDAGTVFRKGELRSRLISIANESSGHRSDAIPRLHENPAEFLSSFSA